MITYQPESFGHCFQEIQPLLENHWKEIANNKETVPLDPDWERYASVEELGMMRIITARDEKKLIGYFVSIISPHMHYRTTVYAMNDILYIDPSYRGGTAAYRLFKHAITDLKENYSVDVVVVHMKVNHEFRKLLSKLGFIQTEENWEARI